MGEDQSIHNFWDTQHMSAPTRAVLISVAKNLGSGVRLPACLPASELCSLTRRSHNFGNLSNSFSFLMENVGLPTSHSFLKN